MNTRTILAFSIAAVCASLGASTADHAATAPALETLRANPFAGEYCGTVGTLGLRINIANGGQVAGSLQGGQLGWSSFRATFSGTVSREGKMCLNLIATVSNRGARRVPSRQTTAVVVLARSEDGSLLGSWQYGSRGPYPFTGTYRFSWQNCQ